MDLNDLRFQRGQLITQARELTDLAATEKRSLSSEEDQRFDKLMADADKLASTIEKSERARVAAAGLDVRGGATVRPSVTNGETPEAEARSAAFRTYLRSGASELSGDERRALSAGDLTSGGYLVAPQQFVASLLTKVKDMVFMRDMATKFQVATSESLGVPTLDTDVGDADWTSELLTGSETTIAFGKRELRPHPLAKNVKISGKLLRQAALDPEAIVRDRLAYKFGVAQEKAFLLGTGVEQPLGVFVASADGIDTGRDTACASQTAVVGDDLISLRGALKPQYLGKSRWLLHRDLITMVRKLKTSTTNEYIWQPGLQAGVPDVLLGLPYIQSEYAPNTFTTGKYVAVLGDFSFYWIADALDMTVQRLVELYAATNQVGFIGRLETDGAPVQPEAFVRLKMA